MYTGSSRLNSSISAADSADPSVAAAAVTSFREAVAMSRSYRFRTSTGSSPPARNPLDAAVLASANDRYTAAASALSGCDRLSTSRAASDLSATWNEATTPNAPINTVNNPATTRNPPGTVRA
ncbi:hypothetical protein AB0948_30610 [Streptomyces koyangensis]|uniref:hypothetical protein n=1 Tax=Streptomyces koyangensis TaxID=188770 RepID=UPI00216B0141|nr:hypothetical protein [Streptomyces koyangensis]